MARDGGADGIARGSVGRKPHLRSLFALWARSPLAALRWLLWGKGEPDYFLGPVRWLFGRELIVYLRSIALYSAFGDELDHRDWMRPELIDLRGEPCEQGGFWFDYISDTGDSQLVMYDMASLLLSDLYVERAEVGQAVSFAPRAERLPRGRFVFFGGDTAYHVADVPTLERRVCAPVTWAYRERVARAGVEPSSSRFAFAIPGNHDYYDSLIGFNHLFRAPGNARLPLADLRRRQEASFVALRLPFDFLFFGLDCQGGRMDPRQREYFRELLALYGSRRLIVATPEPVTVFDAVHPRAMQPFSALSLPRPYTTGTYPEAFELHLDLAGDVHHYARYSSPAAPNYAQIVAGGGAFLHPTQTSWAGRSESSAQTLSGPGGWPPRAAALYPDAGESRRAVIGRLLCPWIILRGGGAFLLGAVSALMAYTGIAMGPGMHGVFVNYVVPRLPGGGLAREIAGWQPDWALVKGVEQVVDAAQPAGQGRAKLLPSEWFALTLIGLSLAFIGLSSRRLFAAASERDEARRQVVLPQRYALVCAAALATLVALGVIHYERASELTAPVIPFLSSFQLLSYLLPFLLSGLWLVKYLATLPKQAEVRRLQAGDSVPRWVAVIFGLGTVSLGLFSYGSGSVAGFALDTGALSALLFSSLVPVLMGVSQGMERGLRHRIGYAALGACFGLFQVALPLCLAVYGRQRTLGAVMVFALLMELATVLVYRRVPRSSVMLAAFVATGVGCLSIALWGAKLAPVDGQSFGVALLSGGLFTCVWLGFYLAVALAFNAHNNEAGGAARLDAFRHIIRFKVEEARITGYVIGFERPEVAVDDAGDGRPVLRPRIVDRFELRPREGLSPTGARPPGTTGSDDGPS